MSDSYKNPYIIRSMDGFDYEKYCIRYLQKHGYKNAELTKSGADQGLDIIAYRHHLKYGFQCKYYEKPVGNSAVQEAYAGAAHYGCDKAAVITNTSFTKSALELAKDTDVLLYSHVDPVKSNRLFNLLRIFLIPGLIYCMVIFYKQAQTGSQSNDMLVMYTSFLFIGLVCGMFSHNAWILSLLSVLLCAIYILISHVSRYVFIYLCLVLILLTIHFLILLLNHMKDLKQDRRKLQEENIHIKQEEIMDTLHKEIETELNCPVSLTNVSFSKKTLTCTCVSQKYIQDDLPLLAYSLEQRSAAKDHANHYDLKQLSPRSFQIQVSLINQA